MSLRLLGVLALGLLPALGSLPPDQLSFTAAERSLETGQLVKARQQIERLLERDRKSIPAWDLRARWADASSDNDDRIYSLHQKLRLSIRQGLSRDDLKDQRELLYGLDPIARDLFGMKSDFTAKLKPIAERYEKRGRPHSAIRMYKEILALDPENAEAQAAIERIAASPDPSLAGDAKPKDLFADVSDEWIQEHDAAHGTWDTRAKLERDNYTTYTDAGYEVLIQAGEARGIGKVIHTRLLGPHKPDARDEPLKAVRATTRAL